MSSDGKSTSQVPAPESYNLCDICSDGAGKDGRNLVVCIDGTANQYSDKSTNVVSLYSRIVKNRGQRTIYFSGIGTYARPSFRSAKYVRQLFASFADSGMAINFETNIFHAYAWLADNYEQDDKIFLFGFSRGAYQVRALAAMVYTIGLLHKGNDAQIPFAFELFTQSDDVHGALDTKMARKKQLFKDTFCRDVRVHFIGAWDTVSSIGFQRKPAAVTNGINSACYFRHALALDERRVKFLPEYFRGGIGDEEEPVSTTTQRSVLRRLVRVHSHTSEDMTPSSEDIYTASDGLIPDDEWWVKPRELRVKEVWFSGFHSDIGGGAMQNDELSLWNPALRWMSFEAIKAGLDVRPPPPGWKRSNLFNSPSRLWKIAEILPFKRLTYLDGSSTTRLPHLGKRRMVRPCQFVHETISNRDGIPEACPTEPDPFASAKRFLEMLKGCCAGSCLLGGDAIAELEELLHQGVLGQQSLLGLGYELFTHLHKMLEYCSHNLVPGDPSYAQAERITDKLLSAQDWIVRLSLPEERGRSDFKCVSQILDISPRPNDWTFPLPFTGHKARVESVAFLGTERIVSGSRDGFVRVWNVRTGHELVKERPEARGPGISCMAVSMDDKWIVYCTDHTADLWSVDTQRVHNLLTDDQSKILCAAVSPDGELVICGMFDGSIQMVQRETLVVQVITKHTDSVRSIALSIDGQFLVTGSDDTTLLLWDAPNFDPRSTPMRGHSDWVRSVAISRNGMRIASGSDDGTVRIWCIESHSTLCTIAAHSSFVRFVSFSPGGEYVLSASSAEDRIRVWRLNLEQEQKEEEAVAIHFAGHVIRSACLSSCGTHIATGLASCLVRVWDRIGGKNEQVEPA